MLDISKGIQGSASSSVRFDCVLTSNTLQCGAHDVDLRNRQCNATHRTMLEPTNGDVSVCNASVLHSLNFLARERLSYNSSDTMIIPTSRTACCADPASAPRYVVLALIRNVVARPAYHPIGLDCWRRTVSALHGARLGSCMLVQGTGGSRVGGDT